MAKSETLELLDALERATEADLIKMEEEIEELVKRLDAMRAMVKVLKIKLHGKPAAAEAGEGRERSGRKDQRRQQIFDWLATNGPASATAIAAATGIPKGSMTSLLNHAWFEHTAEGFTNARAGLKSA